MLETQACCLLTLQAALILEGCCSSPSRPADSILLVVWTWSTDAILCLPTELTMGASQTSFCGALGQCQKRPRTD